MGFSDERRDIPMLSVHQQNIKTDISNEEEIRKYNQELGSLPKVNQW